MLTVEELEKKKRRNRLILVSVLTAVVVLTAAQVFIQQLKFPTPIAPNILIFALVNVNIVLLLVLTLLVFRNLFKVYLERRDNILGSKFRVKLVVAFVCLSLLPAGLLFLVASNLITASVDSWFNIRVEESLNRSLEIAQGYYKLSQANSVTAARSIGEAIATNDLLEKGNKDLLRAMILERGQEYNLGLVQIFSSKGAELVSFREDRASWADRVPVDMVRRGLGGEEVATVRPGRGGDLVQGVAPIFSREHKGKVIGVAAVSSLVPGGLSTKATEVTSALKDYRQLKMLKNPIKGIYIMLFLMVTLVIIFAAVWVGIHLARGITVPIQRLAEGTREVASGNLGYKVDVKASDEIGILVDSFNKMTDDLLSSKADLEGAYLDLKRTNVELSERRAYMETVLQNIATGVLSLDQEGLVNTINQAALGMLGLDPQGVLQKHYKEIFEEEALRPLRYLASRMAEEGRETYDQQVTLRVGERSLTLVVNVSALRDGEGKYLGMVMVLDDISQLIKAQQAMTWREVARRIAHEIKNPLTPIKLSTQRLRKKFTEKAPDYEQIFDECTKTIIQEVDGLKGLVDEFSRYARMPASDPKPDDLNQVVEKVVPLYFGIEKRIRVSSELDGRLPLLNLDAEQMKRALINLVDNAVAA
ncbi:MAG: HAMP domain-containing protein, partial [candidate division NC10 bacterium]|nr:HAMP domain-containing protein [candidate division NC10 bacterium]